MDPGANNIRVSFKNLRVCVVCALFVYLSSACGRRRHPRRRTMLTQPLATVLDFSNCASLSTPASARSLVDATADQAEQHYAKKTI